MKRTCILLLIYLISFCNCAKEGNRQIYGPEFKVFVEEFFLQANLRDMDMQPEDYNFEITFADIKEVGVAGMCNRGSDKITIDPSSWRDHDKEHKEWIIFHELGHCLLDRGHRNNRIRNSCLSYMRGAEDDFNCSLNLYSENWRTYYLDELFDESASLPDWYLLSEDYDSFVNPNDFSKSIKDTIVEKITIDSIGFGAIDNFLVEIDFGNTTASPVQVRLGNIIFESCNKCAGRNRVRILSIGNKLYHRSSIQSFDSDIQLSLIRKEEILGFYVNEVFLHSMEYALVGRDLLVIDARDDATAIELNILLE